ncbi:hypothetical protein 2 [Wenzhou crab virus 4]|uniref:hypothetical protein 2 n=1 Tax=Wenzhou crab virus 4 TaxID=1923561 RepID=UPI00090B2BC8|nr:hypothetical protein 2 [Wenzhou crab virus 4]APG76640.1 hypothetical protein 2 [Wenzhou crab virus 4]
MAGIEKRVLAVVPKPHPDLIRGRTELPRTFHTAASALCPTRTPATADTAAPYLGIPPIYLQPLQQTSREWQEAVLDIARRRKVQDPTLPWSVVPTLEELGDSSCCHLGPIPDRRDKLTHPWFKSNLHRLVSEFWKLPENQWLDAADPLPFEEWVLRFPLARRPLLRQAREEVHQHGLTDKDAVMAVFIKTETSTTATDPRNISPRQLKFLSVLGPYVAAIEKQAKRCSYLVKGLVPEQRGKRTAQSWRAEVIETDFSRFDMTVSQDFIEIVERSMFRRAYPAGSHPDFDSCLQMLSRMTGASSLGVLYSVAGTRASGDAHTSIANGVLNRFVIWACLRNLDPSTWDSFHEGDDGIIHCDKPVKQDICDYLNFAALLGFKLKVVRPLSHEHANFCGRHTCSVCHKEFCDLPRTLSKFHVTFKQGEPKSLLLAKALSYMATDNHTPIISVLCQALIEHLSPVVSKRLLARRIAALGWWDRERVKQGMVTTQLEPTACCRAAVCSVYDWEPALQLAWERQLATWKYGVTWLQPLSVDDYLVDSDAVTIYQG